jgi:hypothetical protein
VSEIDTHRSTALSIASPELGWWRDKPFGKALFIP